MLTGNSLERLQAFKIGGFIDELVRQDQSTTYRDLSFEERLTLLIDAEYTRRLSKKLEAPYFPE